MPIPLIILGALGVAGALAIEKALGLGEQKPETKKQSNPRNNYVPPPDYDDFDDFDDFDDDDDLFAKPDYYDDEEYQEQCDNLSKLIEEDDERHYGHSRLFPNDDD